MNTARERNRPLFNGRKGTVFNYIDHYVVEKWGHWGWIDFNRWGITLTVLANEEDASIREDAALDDSAGTSYIYNNSYVSLSIQQQQTRLPIFAVVLSILLSRNDTLFFSTRISWSIWSRSIRQWWLLVRRAVERAPNCHRCGRVKYKFTFLVSKVIGYILCVNKYLFTVPSERRMCV